MASKRRIRRARRRFPVFLVATVGLVVVAGVVFLLPLLVAFAMALGLVALVALPIVVANRLEGKPAKTRSQPVIEVEPIEVAHSDSGRPARIVEIESLWGHTRGQAMACGLDGAVDEMWPVLALCLRRLEDDPVRLANQGHTLLVLVEGLRDSLRDYSRLAGYSDAMAAASRDRLVNQTLPRMRAGLERFSQRLLLDDVMQLEASLQTLEDTLVLEGISDGRHKSLVA